MAAPAALPPPGGGLPPQQHRSFVEALKSPIPSPLTSSATKLSADHPTSTTTTLPPDAHRMGSHKGSPAIYFKPSHIQHIVQPYHWTLIGKFTHGFNKQNPSLGRPPVEELVLYFKALDLKSDVQLGLLDNRHVLIQIQHYDDFLRLYSRPVWYVTGKPMRIFKWTSSFHVDREAPFAPVWISFPRLPIHFFEKLTLMAIASLLGTPLRLDAPTLALKRPSIARVQVELDLLKPRVEKIWIGVDEGEGFWQSIEYADVPDFCQHCKHVGHSEVQCHVRNPELKVPALRNMSDSIRAGRDKQQKQRFVPTGRQADPSGFFAVADAHPSTSDAATVAKPPVTDSPIAPDPQPPHSAIVISGIQPAGLSAPLSSLRVTLSSDEEVQEVLVADDDALLPTTHASTDEAMTSTDVCNPHVAAVHPQLASNVVDAASDGIPPQTRTEKPATPPTSPVDSSIDIPQSSSVVGAAQVPTKVRDVVHEHGPVDVQLHGTVHQQCLSDLVQTLIPAPILSTQQQFQHSEPCVQEAAQPLQRLELLDVPLTTPPDVSLDPVLAPSVVPPIGQAQLEVSPSVTTSNVLYKGLNPYAPTFHSPTPSEAYGSKSPIIQPPILPTLPSQHHVHPFMGHDMGYNDSDYYHDSFGTDEFGFEDEGVTDEHTYDDITDGSEGAHSRKRKDRRKLKSTTSNLSATKEELNEQSRLLGVRIRNRGRPPGSRNRTYFGLVRTMETRASKSISN